MSLNIKTTNVDFDRSTFIIAQGNASKQEFALNKDTEYVFQANVYSNAASSVVTSFSNCNASGFSLYVGNVFGASASPVISVTNPIKFNNVADWSSTNVVSGMLSARINTTSASLDVAMANSASKAYVLEWWATNNSGSRVLISHVNCTINNTVGI